MKKILKPLTLIICLMGLCVLTSCKKDDGDKIPIVNNNISGVEDIKFRDPENTKNNDTINSLEEWISMLDFVGYDLGSFNLGRESVSNNSRMAHQEVEYRKANDLYFVKTYYLKQSYSINKELMLAASYTEADWEYYTKSNPDLDVEYVDYGDNPYRYEPDYTYQENTVVVSESGKYAEKFESISLSTYYKKLDDDLYETYKMLSNGGYVKGFESDIRDTYFTYTYEEAYNLVKENIDVLKTMYDQFTLKDGIYTYTSKEVNVDDYNGLFKALSGTGDISNLEILIQFENQALKKIEFKVQQGARTNFVTIENTMKNGEVDIELPVDPIVTDSGINVETITEKYHLYHSDVYQFNTGYGEHQINAQGYCTVCGYDGYYKEYVENLPGMCDGHRLVIYKNKMTNKVCDISAEVACYNCNIEIKKNFKEEVIDATNCFVKHIGTISVHNTKTKEVILQEDYEHYQSDHQYQNITTGHNHITYECYECGDTINTTEINHSRESEFKDSLFGDGKYEVGCPDCDEYDFTVPAEHQITTTREALTFCITRVTEECEHCNKKWTHNVIAHNFNIVEGSLKYDETKSMYYADIKCQDCSYQITNCKANFVDNGDDSHQLKIYCPGFVFNDYSNSSIYLDEDHTYQNGECYYCKREE